MSSGIYLLTSPSGKQYVGQSWNIERRMKEYPRPSQLKKGRNFFLIHAIKKYGWKNFKIEILIKLYEQEYLDWYESKCIKIFQTLVPNGYNLKTGGGRGKHHNITRQKISDKKMGIKTGPRSDETRQKISEGHIGKKRPDMKGDNNYNRRIKGAVAGSNNPAAKLTEQDIINIRNDGRFQRIIAEEYGVCRHTIMKIKQRKRWKNI